jgi:NAD(P)-dependent dehydrogenase (short-subunit alcohol dehydrogenase family)
VALPEFDLTGKKALVVGAGRGIGAGIAVVLAEAGADVAVTALTQANVDRVAEQIRAHGRQALPLAGDATLQADMDRLAEQVLNGLDGLDVLVNCVGDSIRSAVIPLPNGATEAMDQTTWQAIQDINLTSAFLGCRAFGPHLLAQRSGAVVNVASFAAVRVAVLRSAYDAAKAGLVQFTKSLALEWAPYGVRVNALSPGSFPDPAQMSPEQMQDWRARNAGRIPLAREGRLRDTGLAALYLASDAAAYVTGANLVVDGGLVLV